LSTVFRFTENVQLTFITLQKTHTEMIGLST